MKIKNRIHIDLVECLETGRLSRCYQRDKIRNRMYWVNESGSVTSFVQVTSSISNLIKSFKFQMEKGLIYQQLFKKNLIWKSDKDELTRTNTSDSGVRLAAES